MSEPQEFDCADCKRAIVSFGGPPAQTKCATCLNLPGWFLTPELRRVFEPDETWEPPGGWRALCEDFVARGEHPT